MRTINRENDSLSNLTNTILKNIGSQFAFGLSLNSDVLKDFRKNQEALTSIAGIAGSMKATQLAFGSSLSSDVLKDFRKNQEVLTSIAGISGSMKATQLAFGSSLGSDVLKGFRKNQEALTSIAGISGSMKATQLAFGSSLSSDVLKDFKKSQEALTSIVGIAGSMKATQLAFGSSLSSDVLKDFRKNQETAAKMLGRLTATSLDISKNINNLAKIGTIGTLQANFGEASRVSSSIKALQSQLAKSVEAGIPEGFIENLNRISDLTFTYSDIPADEIEINLYESQVDQNISEITQELEENPEKIWEKMNLWANEILEASENLKKKLPFVFLILQIIFLIGSFVIVPLAQDLVKDKILHQLNLEEQSPAKNAKKAKETLSEELDNATSMLHKVRVTNRNSPVFRSNKRKSGKVDIIPINRAVIIINKKKNWSFVMYVNEHGEEVTGWVFTGNLTR